jgi:type IV secretory pathway VirB6-like protein
MATKSQFRRKAISVTQVGWAAFFFAIVGGIYGLFTGGPANMIILFVECFIGGFILFYIGASFIELLRK